MPSLDLFDPAHLRLDSAQTIDLTNLPETARPPRHKPGERFLKGPIPWRWLVIADRLSGRGLALGLCLWRIVGWRRSRTVEVNLGHLDLEMARGTARKALRALEDAGLVRVERRLGQCCRVTVLDVEVINGEER
jgi:hypothetical protein